MGVSCAFHLCLNRPMKGTAAVCRLSTLSTPFPKYDQVCGEGFLAQTRRERRAYPSGVCKERATTSGPKRTAARRVASHLASGFVAPRSQSAGGYAPSSRLARSQMRRNKRGRIYETGYLGLNLINTNLSRRLSAPGHGQIKL